MPLFANADTLVPLCADRRLTEKLSDAELRALTPEEVAYRTEHMGRGLAANVQAIEEQFRTAEVFKEFLEQEPEPGTWLHVRWQMGNISEHWIVSLLVASLVLGNAVLIGMNADGNIDEGVFQSLVYCFLTIFCLEIAFKMAAFGSELYFQDSWNTFDFVVVAVSCLELIISSIISMPSVASVLRLLRIFRVLRLVSSLKELEIILRSFVNSLSAVTWVAVLTIIMLYIFGVIATLSFGRSEALANAVPESQMYFGTVARSMFTMTQIMTMEWVEPTRAVAEYYPAAWPFFVFFLFFAGIGVLNLFTAIYVDRLQQLTQEDESMRAEQKLSRRRDLEQELSDVFASFDLDDSGTLDEDELKNALDVFEQKASAESADQRNNFKAQLAEFGMSLETIVVALYKFGNRFKNASSNSDGIEYKEFIHSCFTMHDPATRQDATEVNARIKQEVDEHRDRLTNLEAKIVEVNSLVTKLLSNGGARVGREAVASPMRAVLG